MLRHIASQVQQVMTASPMMRTVNTDWGTRTPTLHFTLQQDRMQAIGLSSSQVAQQLQFLLTGLPVTAVREDIRTVQVIARSAGDTRLDPAKIMDFTLAGADGQRIPLSQVGSVDVRMEEPVMRRRDRAPTITVRGDIADGLQPPDVSTAITRQLQPVIDKLPSGYRIEQAGSIEESGKAMDAMLPLFPIMLAITLIIIILQVRSISAMVMVFLTSPLGLIGVVPTLILFQQPFGINALVGLIALSGILMRNTLILIGQIHHNEQEGLDPFQAVVEATVQRARPVDTDGAGGHSGVHPADPFGILGHARLHTDRRHLRRHGIDLGVPACDVFDLVQNQARWQRPGCQRRARKLVGSRRGDRTIQGHDLFVAQRLRCRHDFFEHGVAMVRSLRSISCGQGRLQLADLQLGAIRRGARLLAP